MLRNTCLTPGACVRNATFLRRLFKHRVREKKNDHRWYCSQRKGHLQETGINLTQSIWRLERMKSCSRKHQGNRKCAIRTRDWSGFGRIKRLHRVQKIFKVLSKGRKWQVASVVLDRNRLNFYETWSSPNVLDIWDIVFPLTSFLVSWVS